jgi:hypothetical protein
MRRLNREARKKSLLRDASRMVGSIRGMPPHSVGHARLQLRDAPFAVLWGCPNLDAGMYWYTAGLSLYDLPELILTGLNEVGADVLRELGTQSMLRPWRAGSRFPVDEDFRRNADGEIPDGPEEIFFTFRNVSPTQQLPLAATYKIVRRKVDVMQVVWPDVSGLSPLDPEWAGGYQALLPQRHDPNQWSTQDASPQEVPGV